MMKLTVSLVEGKPRLVDYPVLARGNTKFNIESIVPLNFKMHPVMIYNFRNELEYAFASLECAAKTMHYMRLRDHFVIDERSKLGIKYTYKEMMTYA